MMQVGHQFDTGISDVRDCIDRLGQRVLLEFVSGESYLFHGRILSIIGFGSKLHRRAGFSLYVCCYTCGLKPARRFSLTALRFAPTTKTKCPASTTNNPACDMTRSMHSSAPARTLRV